MSTNNDNDDQVNQIARDENARIRTDLMRGIFGAMPTGRIERGGAVFAKNEILQKQKEKDKEEQRSAFKRAQEAFERALKELEEQLEAIKKQIEEARKELLDVEEQLRKKYGDNWEEKFRKGEVDWNDRLYQKLLHKHEELEELEKKYKRIEELKKELGKEGLTPKMRAKLDKLAETSDGKRLAAKSIDLSDDADKKMEAVERLGFTNSSKDLASSSLKADNIYASTEEFTLDAPVKSTSFAKSIDGNSDDSMSLRDNFHLKANEKNTLPEKTFDAETKTPSQAVPEQSIIPLKNG